MSRFRWVACQLDHICSLTTDRERILALQSLPPTLPATYDRILERLNQKSESACRLVERVLKWLIRPALDPKILSWIDPAVMPRMSARELCVAISINFGDSTTSFDAIPSVEEIMIHASSFLRLSQDQRYVGFAHFTVEEYLRAIDPLEKPGLARYRWDELSASTYQVETCLSFLNLDNFRPSRCGSLDMLQQLLQTHPFYITASVLWNSCSALSRSSARAKNLVSRLLCPADDAFQFDNWLQVRLLASYLYKHGDLVTSYFYDDALPGSPIDDTLSNVTFKNACAKSLAIAANISRLHIGAMFHLVDQIPHLVDADPQINVSSAFGTPLHCALAGDAFIEFVMSMKESHRHDDYVWLKPHVDCATLSSTIALLLKLGADPRVPFNTGSAGTITALYLATFSSAAQQVLEGGATIDADTAQQIMRFLDRWPNTLYLEPLAKASLDSVSVLERPSVAQLLMRINPDSEVVAPRTVPSDQATKWQLEATIQQACERNQLPVFRWIFESCDLDVNHRLRQNNSTLLHLACSGFAAEIAAYLVGKGADVNLQDGNGFRPLQRYFGSDRWRNSRLSPLHGASRSSRQDCRDTLRSIVAGKAQLDTLTTTCESALMLWAQCKSSDFELLEEALHALLNGNADVEMKDIFGNNIWHHLAICRRRHNEHAKMLKSFLNPTTLEATINITNNEGLTPILHAISTNSMELAEFLIEQGCDCTVSTPKGESVLHLAASHIWANSDLFQTLLANSVSAVGVATDGSTIAHFCVRAVTDSCHLEEIPVDMASRFKESIESLSALSITVTASNLKGQTPLDQLCLWIAEHGHHEQGTCQQCEICFMCFESLVAQTFSVHEQMQGKEVEGSVTWANILHHGLRAQLQPTHGSMYDYPQQTVCYRAIGAAVNYAVALSSLGIVTKLDHSSIFETAAMVRHEPLIIQLLEITGIDVDRPALDAALSTPLELLCMHCCPANTIQMAIARTRKLREHNTPQGLSFLHLLFLDPNAQLRSMAPLIQTLVDAGIDVDKKTNDTGLTALMMAAAMDVHSDAVETLLSTGAKVDVLDGKSLNALFHACASGSESTIESLVVFGSPVSHGKVQLSNSPWDGDILCGPIHLAAARGMASAVELLLLEESVDVEDHDLDKYFPDPLLMACVANSSTVRLLLEHGFDPDCEDPSTGTRPLHVASRAGNVHIVHALLDAGCDKEARDHAGLTAWMTATFHGHTDVAVILKGSTRVSPVQDPPFRATEDRNLVLKSADRSKYAVESHYFDAEGSRHSLPAAMRQTLINGKFEVVRQLVRDGMDMRLSFAGCSCTPMLIAVYYKRPEVATHLFDTGVPLITEDKCSLHFVLEETVLELLAADPTWTRLVEQWFRQPAWRARLSRYGLLHMIASAIDYNNPKTLKILLARIDYPIPSLETAASEGPFSPKDFLHKAVKNLDTSCASILLSHGLDVDCVDHLGRTALQRATSHGQLEMVELLLSHKAAVNAASTSGGTALSIAAGAGYVNIINRLLAAGADPNFYLSPKQTPVTCAAVQGQYAAFLALVDAGGISQINDEYALYDRGYRSVLMFDERYFDALQSPRLMRCRVSPENMMPILRSMPSTRRALFFAMLYPEEEGTILHGACMSGSLRFVDFAIRHGASINMESSPHGTPLMAACFAGHQTIVQYLVRSGALLSYWNGTEHISALVKAQPHPRILRWLLVGRFTGTLRLTEVPTGGDLQLDATETSYSEADAIHLELILDQDVNAYFEENFWFVPARRFVDSGDGSFEELDILPSEFAEFKPTYV